MLPSALFPRSVGAVQFTFKLEVPFFPPTGSATVTVACPGAVAAPGVVTWSIVLAVLFALLITVNFKVYVVFAFSVTVSFATSVISSLRSVQVVLVSIVVSVVECIVYLLKVSGSPFAFFSVIFWFCPGKWDIDCLSCCLCRCCRCKRCWCFWCCWILRACFNCWCF